MKQTSLRNQEPALAERQLRKKGVDGNQSVLGYYLRLTCLRKEIRKEENCAGKGQDGA